MPHKKAEWKQLCEECFKATKKAGFTKEDTDRIIKETREMQWKAQKYDELIENLEQIQKESAENISPQTMKKYATVRMEEIDDETYILLAMHRIGFAGEILAILKGEKEV